MLFSPSLARKETFHSEYLDEDIIDLLGGSFNVPESYACSVTPIDPGFDGRPDLIADEIYGDDMFADIIVHLNGTGNPFEMCEGQYLIVPSQDSVEEFFVSPAKEWSEQYLAAREAKPKPKARSEKRKPNEAVIGDKRFNIDPQSKIIIY